MDTLIFAISKHCAFVCDYYKNEFKTLQFNKNDLYELYCSYDVGELIDYLNYPLNYKNFKDTDIIMMYDEPIIYEYLYKNRLRFSQANKISLIPLKSVIWAYILNKNPNEIYSFEGTFFQIDEKNNLQEIEEQEEIIATAITLIHLSKMLLGEINTTVLNESVLNDIVHLQENNHINTEFSKCLVLSPATIRIIKKDNSQFLNVNDILIEESLIKDKTMVKVGDLIFSYEHEVTKMWKRKQISIIEKKAETNGIFYWQNNPQDDIWAKKDAIVGVILAP
ncbi:hypothetical protein AN641_07410 [Candidatus Epulonipiscioides gigas]|nr:hypothetical protein AN641_07410 [Epulopiscium sp. SCG-C07WGA-EpuloA2]